jgi:hypothetical protein
MCCLCGEARRPSPFYGLGMECNLKVSDYAFGRVGI